MSSFWSWWVIIITVGNILACYWLIQWATKPRTGEAATGDVTGHKWDDNLEEFNNPLPRWWLWLFYITIVFGLAYIVMYPGLGKFAGTNKWTSTGQYEAEIARANAKYDPIFAAYAKQSVEDLARDAKAVQIGQRLFINYCATCHGSDAGGARGFPNLTDNDWQYGGAAHEIKTSILDGRVGVMPPWEAALGEQGLDQVTQYVLSLSGRDHDAAKAAAGKTMYDTMCIACHGADGTGNKALGAPNLTDNVWLYGRSPGEIRLTLAKGRNGVMPAHRDFLGEDKVHLLAAYVYSLSAR